MVNWTGREDKRNVLLDAVAAADNKSGYVFGMHSNFDPGLDPSAIEQAATAAGDVFGLAQSISTSSPTLTQARSSGLAPQGWMVRKCRAG